MVEPTVSDIERFDVKVITGPGCWLWVGAHSDTGYGNFWLDHRYVGAHRVAYEWLVGPIPAGLELDHLCRNRSCVNPDHLEPVTRRQNTLRGVGPTAVNAVKTHCQRGHALAGSNVYTSRNGKRRCQACWRASMAAFELRNPGRSRRYRERKAS